jgi:CheY-like chemotaxis protein
VRAVSDAPRLLIVDDDADIREALGAVLGDTLEVSTAANGREALARVRDAATRPDVVLLDLMMPVLDGWGFLGAIAADPALSDLPVVTMTAAITLGETARAHPLVRAHLTKPFGLEEVERLVAALAPPRRAP